MQIDPVSMAPIYNSLTRQTGRILEEDDQGILIADQAGSVLMIWHNDLEQGRRWLERHLPDYPGFMVLSLQTGMGACLKETLPLRSFQTCTQFVALPSTPSPAPASDHESTLQVRAARLEDLPYITAHYSLCSPDTLRRAIEEGRLFFFLDAQGTPVGFAGEHPEGAMGFLTVDPVQRRRGYGRQMEQWLMDFERRRGLIPYCHVFADNAPSMALQHQLHLYPCTQDIEWMWHI